MRSGQQQNKDEFDDMYDQLTNPDRIREREQKETDQKRLQTIKDRYIV